MAEPKVPPWLGQLALTLLMSGIAWWTSAISEDVGDLVEGMARMEERTIKMDGEITRINNRLDLFARREALRELAERVDRLHGR